MVQTAGNRAGFRSEGVKCGNIALFFFTRKYLSRSAGVAAADTHLSRGDLVAQTHKFDVELAACLQCVRTRINFLCVFCSSPRGLVYRQRGERSLKDQDFCAVFSSSRSRPLKAILHFVSPPHFSPSCSWKETRRVRRGRRLSKAFWTSKRTASNGS